MFVHIGAQFKLTLFFFARKFFIDNIMEFLKKRDAQGAKNAMEIHYINVGQGDSILIRVNNKNMLQSIHQLPVLIIL